MSKQETLTIFPEIEDTTQDLTNEQFGELMRAVMAYRFRGQTYTGNDPFIKFAFRYMANQVDRSETAKTAKSKAAKERWGKQGDAEACKVMQSDAEACKVMQSDAPILSIPSPSPSPIQSIENIAAEPHAPAKKKTRKTFGKFGWVKLSSEEYDSLLNDLGQAEVERCIAYVDESAQTTNNKNKWRDWNLVIRKCSRDGWGLQKAGYGKKPVPMGASGVLGEAELEAIRRATRDNSSGG
jgi:hypothetical protein